MKAAEGRDEKKGGTFFWGGLCPEMSLYAPAQERGAIMSVEAEADAAHREQ